MCIPIDFQPYFARRDRRRKKWLQVITVILIITAAYFAGHVINFISR
jgi:hypothetical protein